MAKKPKAVVLGVGAERGVGAGLSRRFAKEGYHVLVAGRFVLEAGQPNGARPGRVLRGPGYRAGGSVP